MALPRAILRGRWHLSLALAVAMRGRAGRHLPRPGDRAVGAGVTKGGINVAAMLAGMAVFEGVEQATGRKSKS